jgi:RHS repeat-associated protein
VIGTVAAAPYTLNWSNVPAGRYNLSVRATDNSGVSTTSAAVPVIVDAAPTVSISAPADQSGFRAPASFALSATASDSDGSIARVEIYQNGSLLQTLTAAPYTINVSVATPGSYVFFARAFDDLGISTQSAPIAVTVSPDVAPVITLTAPTDGAKLKTPASITVSAAANDPDGTIARVDFFQNGTLVGSATQAPFSITLGSVRAGSYTFLARAVDDGGVTSDSAPVSVTVAAGQQMYYIHTDQINTPRVVTDQSGKVVWRWDNADPFGEALPDEDPDGDGNRFTLNLRFPGQYFDRETQTHHNYFRDYDPATGRYFESDPIGLFGGVNSYAYVRGAPPSYIDPFGLVLISPFSPEDMAGGGGGYAGGGGGVSGGAGRGVAAPSARSSLPSRAQSNPAKGRYDFDHTGPRGYDEAVAAAREKAGDLGPQPQRMYDPQTGTLIGEQSASGKRGWRIDQDHCNWWDWTPGKKGNGGTYGHEWFPEEQVGPHSRYPGFAPWGEQ